MFFKQKDNIPTAEKSKMLFDSVLNSQQLMAEGYCKCSFECSSESLREDMLNIMREEQTIYYTLADEMKRRGWQKESAANSNEKSAALQQYKNIKNTL